MSPRPGLRLLAAALPLGLLAPAAAHAEKVVTEDAAGDVVTLPDGSTSESTPAPDYAGVDVQRTTVAHGDRRLSVVVGFRALERNPFHLTLLRVMTPSGRYDVAVERLGGKPVASLAGGPGDAECRGLKAKVDLGADTVSLSMPTTCLGSPRWVRLRVGSVAASSDTAQPEMGAAYVDDAYRAGEVRDRLALGPKVHRG